ncbi:hypothetical protein [Martelella limonii]|nr:hypothetical protein [Martelella limonii]
MAMDDAVEGLFALRLWRVEEGVDLQSQLDEIEAMLLSRSRSN